MSDNTNESYDITHFLDILMNPRWTDDELAEVRSLFESGKTNQEIAEHFGDRSSAGIARVLGRLRLRRYRKLSTKPLSFEYAIRKRYHVNMGNLESAVDADLQAWIMQQATDGAQSVSEIINEKLRVAYAMDCIE